MLQNLVTALKSGGLVAGGIAIGRTLRNAEQSVAPEIFSSKLPGLDANVGATAHAFAPAWYPKLRSTVGIGGNISQAESLIVLGVSGEGVSTALEQSGILKSIDLPTFS